MLADAPDNNKFFILAFSNGDPIVDPVNSQDDGGANAVTLSHYISDQVADVTGLSPVSGNSKGLKLNTD